MDHPTISTCQHDPQIEKITRHVIPVHGSPDLRRRMRTFRVKEVHLSRMIRLNSALNLMIFTTNSQTKKFLLSIQVFPKIDTSWNVMEKCFTMRGGLAARQFSLSQGTIPLATTRHSSIQIPAISAQSDGRRLRSTMKIINMSFSETYQAMCCSIV